jgi:hypothetical protein
MDGNVQSLVCDVSVACCSLLLFCLYLSWYSGLEVFLLSTSLFSW